MAITIESNGSSKAWSYIIPIVIAIGLTIFVTYKLLDKKYDFKDLRNDFETAVDSSSVIALQVKEIEKDKLITLDEVKALKAQLEELEKNMNSDKDTTSLTLEQALEIINK